MGKSQQQVADTAFAHVITEHMWRQRPPWSNAIVAYKLTQAGIPITRVAVHKWTALGQIPTVERQIAVMDALGIPRTELRDAYRALGQEVPPLLLEILAPRPKPSARREPPQEEWQAMIDATVEGMRAAGISEQAIAQVVEHIRRKRHDERPLQRNLVAEHSPSYGTGEPSLESSGEDEGEDKGEDDAGRSRPGSATDSRPRSRR